MRAVSPLVATAILLVITVAGGVLIYNYMSSTLKSPQNYASLTVEDAKMLVDGNRTIVSLKVSNIGTGQATIDAITIIPDNITLNASYTIDPGMVKSINIMVDKPLSTSVKHYVVIVYGDQETSPARITLLK